MINQFQNPAVLYYNGIGDHLMTLPAVRAFSCALGERMTLACLPIAKEVFRGVSARRNVYIGPGADCWKGDDFDANKLAKRLQPCDLLVSLNRKFTTSMAQLLCLVRPIISVGLFPEFSVHFPFDQTRHSVDLAFDVARCLDPQLELDDFSSPPELPYESIRAAKYFRSLLPPDSRCLAVHADTAEEKMWPAKQFSMMLNLFLSEHQDFVVQLLGTRDLGLKDGPHARRIINCHGVPLSHSFALVRDADLFLGVDSALLHAADLFRIPSVGLFGPSDRQQFGFRFCRHRYITSHAPIERVHREAVVDSLDALLEPHD
jgi:ADP-heptose:LPS heptosyltransferase